MPTNVRFIYGHYTNGKTVTATSTASGYSADSGVDLDRTNIWVSGAGASINYTVDLGAATAVTGVGLANHNLSTVIGEGATIQLRGSTDNFSASDVLVKALVPTTDSDYYATFGSATYRYWRVKMTSVGATAPQFGEFYLGTVFTVAANPVVGMPERDVPRTFQSRSISGRKVVKKTGRITRSVSMSYDAIDSTEWGLFRTMHTSQDGGWKPLFYVPWNSGTPTEGEAFFVRIEDFSWDDIGFGLYDLKMSLEEEQ